MGKYFGTDGFRGEANVDLTVEHAYQVGRFLGWYYGKDKKEKCKVVIGKDTRRSSYMFEYSLKSSRFNCFWSRCLSVTCNNNPKCFLCSKNRRF